MDTRTIVLMSAFLVFVPAAAQSQEKSGRWSGIPTNVRAGTILKVDGIDPLRASNLSFRATNVRWRYTHTGPVVDKANGNGQPSPSNFCFAGSLQFSIVLLQPRTGASCSVRTADPGQWTTCSNFSNTADIHATVNDVCGAGTNGDYSDNEGSFDLEVKWH